MNLLTIPLRNMRRKWLRTALLALVFSIGVLSVVALGYVARSVGESFEKKLSQFGANIVVYPRSDTLTLSYGGMSLGQLSYDVRYLREDEVVGKIRSIHLKERISAVAPKLLVLAGTEERPLGVIGVDFVQEQRIKSHWHWEGSYPAQGTEVLAGASAARLHGLAPGSAFMVEGASFTVSGVLAETGTEEDDFVFVDLHTLQTASGRAGQVNFVEVAALCAGCPIDEMVTHISHALPGLDVKALSQVVKSRMYSIDFVNELAWGVSLIILLTSCVMISLSLYASVGERKKEIGLLRSLGYSRGSVFAMFSFEAFVLGLLASILGYLGGLLSSGEILRLLGMADAAVAAPSSLALLAHFGVTLGLVSILTMASSAMPAWKAARIEPSEAFSLL